MRGARRLMILASLVGLASGLTVLSERAASRAPQAAPSSAADEALPAYHTKAPQGDLPETMSPDFFSDPLVQNAYAVAAKIKKTLYQQPCYCHCDKSQGHASLLDCFASKHGSVCGTCIYEDFYSYEQGRKGKTAAQIREGIIKGEWQTVDASKYQRPLPAK